MADATTREEKLRLGDIGLDYAQRHVPLPKVFRHTYVIIILTVLKEVVRAPARTYVLAANHCFQNGAKTGYQGRSPCLVR